LKPLLQSLFIFLTANSFHCVAQPSGNALLDQTVSIIFSELELDSALSIISDSTGINFSYKSNLVEEKQRFTIIKNNASIRDILNFLFTGTSIEYFTIKSHIILKKVSPTPQENEFEIFGEVLDKNTNEPIAGVNVYLKSSFKGSATDSNGIFQIPDVKSGAYELSFSHISYQLLTVRVDIENRNLKVEASMLPRTHFLEDVKLESFKDTGDSMAYSEMVLKKFSNEFLGETKNAYQCEIINPGILKFSWDGQMQTIKCSSDSALIIENNALGYRLTHNIKKFEHRHGITKNVGSTRFLEMKPESRKQAKKWKKNRRKSYDGSLKHFLKSLVEDKIKKEGFEMRYLKKIPESIKASDYSIAKRNEVLSGGSSIYTRTVNFPDYLLVIYKREIPSEGYVNFTKIAEATKSNEFIISYRAAMTNNRPKEQLSILEINKSGFPIDVLGNILEPLSIKTYGYWSWERMAEALPIEYEPN